MGASAYIGRVGGLAAALGIGAAVAMGQGVAWAVPTESDPSTAESPPSADATAGPDSAPAAPAAPDTTPAATTPEPPPEAARQSQTPSLTTLTSRANSLLSSLTRAAERGIAVSTGGALTSEKATSQKSAGAAEVAEAEPEVAEVAEAEPEEADVVEAAKPAPVEKKRSAPANKPVERLVHHLQAAKPTADVRGVGGLAAKVVAAAKPAETVIHHTVVAVEQKTVQDTAPVMMAAAEAPVARPTVARLLTNLVSVFGLGALASDTPGAPLGTPFVTALLALGIRREESVSALSKSAAVGTTPVAALALTDPPTAAVAAAPSDPSTSYSVTPVVVSPNTSIITKVTGPGGLNNTPARFGIGGTDLGIMWDNGIADNPSTTAINEHQVLILFGDTFSSTTPVRTGVWRNNMLLRSSDNMLSNGMYVRDGSVPVNGTTADDFTGAPLVYNPELNQNIFKQVIANERYAVGQDITIIPTSAVSVPYNNAYGSRQYANFMSVRSWDTPGRWTTNYSGIAFSDDNGVTWHVARESIRPAAVGRSTMPYVSGNQNFQQGAFVKPPAASADAAAGWVYSYGTPSGRAGTVYLSRVQQDQILDATKYQYWNGTAWVTNAPSAAKPVLPGTTTSWFFGLFKSTTYPTAGEMSVQYNEYEQKYVMLYTDQSNNVVMRKADRPEGPWSAPTTSGDVVEGARAVCADDPSLVVDDERHGVRQAVPVLESVDVE